MNVLIKYHWGKIICLFDGIRYPLPINCHSQSNVPLLLGYRALKKTRSQTLEFTICPPARILLVSVHHSAANYIFFSSSFFPPSKLPTLSLYLLRYLNPIPQIFLIVMWSWCSPPHGLFDFPSIYSWCVYHVSEKNFFVRKSSPSHLLTSLDLVHTSRFWD